ncbi:hypothetical protein PR202_gn00910 [Eleusine coracana subsp. coracana]|uniref:Uncharacterized protein n=1 Tax=Eleusine coracana subsp. coracana TaxID=191504 RepID=A0AAV5G5Q8_ELECO|nr:hypothetical protein PR202_gn00910 [Eleusine coracana subsp. coracana]
MDEALSRANTGKRRATDETLGLGLASGTTRERCSKPRPRLRQGGPLSRLDPPWTEMEGRGRTAMVARDGRKGADGHGSRRWRGRGLSCRLVGVGGVPRPVEIGGGRFLLAEAHNGGGVVSGCGLSVEAVWIE